MRQYRKQEESLQIAVSTYIKLQYPDVYFTCESSGVRLTIGQAVKMKKQRSNHKQLDMIILEPKGGYHGLILELKRDRNEIYTKNGLLKINEHTQEQLKSIVKLEAKGYYADFGCGFDHIKIMIDNYMKLK